jgi:hypothetical protein
MPKSQHVDGGCLNLIAYFIVADEDSANFTRFEFVKPFTDSRLLQYATGCGC